MKLDLSKEILIKLLEKETIQVTFDGLDMSPAQLIELKSYQALKEIKSILENDALDDNECFLKIEAIISVLEDLGSGGGNRHDFG